jgi:hypothetical protein
MSHKKLRFSFRKSSLGHKGSLKGICLDKFSDDRIAFGRSPVVVEEVLFLCFRKDLFPLSASAFSARRLLRFTLTSFVGACIGYKGSCTKNIETPRLCSQAGDEGLRARGS